MKKISLKETKGITLIALVITIIVMLILVAVTISLAINGGLFGYAGKAAEQTKTAIEKEQGLGEIEDGLTTDDLIALLTSNKEDLRKLKLYFVGKNMEDIYDEDNDCCKNNDIIPDANRSVIFTERKNIIKYHNNLYRIITDIHEKQQEDGEFTIVVTFVDVEALSDEEVLAMQIKDSGYLISQTKTREAIEEPAVSYYEYKNKIYRLDNHDGTVETIVKNDNETVVIFGGNHIKFTPKTNQTWYDWAIEEKNNIDLSLEDIKPGLTLKGLIMEVNGKENKRISSETLDTAGQYYQNGPVLSERASIIRSRAGLWSYKV